MQRESEDMRADALALRHILTHALGPLPTDPEHYRATVRQRLEELTKGQPAGVALVKAGLFVVAEVDGELLCDVRQRTLMLHVSTLVAAGADVTLEGQVFTVAEVVHREADVPVLRLRAKP